MNLKQKYEDETGEDWEVDNDRYTFPSYEYVEWLEKEVSKLNTKNENLVSILEFYGAI